MVRPMSLELAPGRETWLFVSTFVQTSPTHLESVTPDVSFESSAPAIVGVTSDSAGVAHVVAKRPGSASVTVRSRYERANVSTVTVAVKAAPIGDEKGLAMSASARFVPTASGRGSSSLGPMELEVTATIANPTRTAKDIWLGGCPAWIRIYATPADTGRPLADIPRGATCMATAQHVVLAPGESRTLPAGGFRTISEDTLPNGRVYVFAAVDRIRDIVNVPAGPLDAVSPNAGLALEARTTVAGARQDTVRTRVTVTNTNAQPVRLEYGACSITLLAYRSATRTGAPIWNSSMRRAPEGAVYGCPLYLAVGVAQPGETMSPKEFNVAYAIREVLGDSLPDGRYYFAARVRLNWRTSVVSAGEAEVRRGR